MSDHHHELDISRLTSGETLDRSKLSTISLACGGIGVLGLIISIVLLLLDSTRPAFAYSWLWAFYFFASLSMGGLFWVLLHNMTNASWGIAVRRLKENLAVTFPLFALLAIPFLFPAVQDNLWEWMDAHRDVAAHLGTKVTNIDAIGDYFRHTHHGEIYQEHHHMTLLGSKMDYMNIPRWTIMLIGSMLLLSWFALRLRRMSVKQDEVGGTRLTFKMRGASAWMLAVYALIVTFLAIDLLKGLDYTWYSTMWGVYVFAGSAGPSMALLILITITLERMGYLKGVVTEEHYHVMGKLLLAFTMFWGYIAFSQFMLIWYANIPEETMWFRLRNTGIWWWASVVGLLVFRFLIPFLILLQAWIKKDARFFAPFCVYFLLMQAFVFYVDIIPERGPSLTSSVVPGRALDPSKGFDPQMFISWAWLGDLLAFVTIGCLFVFVLIRVFSKDSLFPRRDPRLVESMDIVN